MQVSRRSVRVAVAVATVAIGAAAVVGPAYASTAKPSSFSFGITSTTIVDAGEGDTPPSDNGALLPGGQASVSASVKPGVLVGSAGTVAFTDTTTGTALGTVPVGSDCFFRFAPCVVSTTVDSTQLAAGANTITASYSGGFFLAPSSGSAELDLESQSTTDGTTTTNCAYDCTTGEVTSSDDTTNVFITGVAGSSATVTESFSTDPLPCTTDDDEDNPIGDPVIFTSSGVTSNKTIFYQVSGEAADELEDIYEGGENLCYESPNEFTTASGSPAQIDELDGLYYGILPQCQLPSNSGEEGFDGDALNPPCEDFSEFYDAGGDGPDLYNQQAEVTAGDPKMSN